MRNPADLADPGDAKFVETLFAPRELDRAIAVETDRHRRYVLVTLSLGVLWILAGFFVLSRDADPTSWHVLGLVTISLLIACQSTAQNLRIYKIAKHLQDSGLLASVRPH